MLSSQLRQHPGAICNALMLRELSHYAVESEAAARASFPDLSVEKQILRSLQLLASRHAPTSSPTSSDRGDQVGGRVVWRQAGRRAGRKAGTCRTHS